MKRTASNLEEALHDVVAVGRAKSDCDEVDAALARGFEAVLETSTAFDRDVRESWRVVMICDEY